MARPAEPGRRALLAAGTALLDDPDGPGLGVSVNAVVGRAGMSKGAFYQHWPDRTAYLIGLHRTFHDNLDTTVRAALDGRPPGADRLAAGVAAYLDACLTAAGTKALLAQARHDPALAAEVSARDAAFTQLALPDVATLGWRPAEPAAALLVAMVAAVALAENTTRHPQPDLRAAALAYAMGTTSVTRLANSAPTTATP